MRVNISAVVDDSARHGATALWNSRACGELDGSPEALDYFQRVEADRYKQQPWQHDYFSFDQFAGKKVLEIGVGQGTDLVQFARAGAECFGVDITDNHLDLASKNFALRSLDVELHKADATSLPFPDASLDCVYSFGVIHHIPEAPGVVSEIKRVLKPGGTVMVALYYKWSAFYLSAKLLRNGILSGDLLRLGHEGLLATIETGADGKNLKPYVKLYTKKAMRALFRDFEVKDVSVHQLTLGHLLPSAFCFGKDNAPLPLDWLCGWYVTCKATR